MPDQTPALPWTIPSTQPVIAPGALHPGFDNKRASAPHIIHHDDGYLMMYWGTAADGKNYILSAESTLNNPHHWNPRGAPLIGPQPETEYNCVGPSFPFLLPLTDSHWLLYFCAWGVWPDERIPNTTGVAMSDDAGKSWRYHIDHPVIPLDRSYEKDATGSIWIIREGELLRMYYTAIASHGPKPAGAKTGHGDVIPQIGIGYAESRDGLHWEKPFDTWVVSPRGFGVEPYEYICSKPCVIKTESGYIMWMNTFGTAYRVHRLTSTDGVKWDWARRVGPDGELGHGVTGGFDDQQRSYPTIVKNENRLACWFTGNRFGETGIGYAEQAI